MSAHPPPLFSSSFLSRKAFTLTACVVSSSSSPSPSSSCELAPNKADPASFPASVPPSAATPLPSFPISFPGLLPALAGGFAKLKKEPEAPSLPPSFESPAEDRGGLPKPNPTGFPILPVPAALPNPPNPTNPGFDPGLEGGGGAPNALTGVVDLSLFWKGLEDDEEDVVANGLGSSEDFDEGNEKAFLVVALGGPNVNAEDGGGVGALELVFGCFVVDEGNVKDD